jgi:hypothetical protein
VQLTRLLDVRRTRAFVAVSVIGGAAGACALPTHSTRLAEGPEPVELRMDTQVLRSGQEALVVVRSPSADSIVLVSTNGVDRWWSDGPRLVARMSGDFGDRTPVRRYAERRNGVLLDRLMKPAVISVCREDRCRDFFHEFEVRLPERNQRTVALSGGWNSVFARRTVRGLTQGPLFREALSSGVFFVEGELAAKSWNVRGQGYYGPESHGASLDLSRVIKQGDEVSYGIAMHVGATRTEWLPDGRGLGIADRTGYSVSVGPSIMLRGVTASSQFGLLTNGRETLQVIGTRISANGRLTSVRIPVSVTAEKTYAFGGGPIISRRRDAVERLSAAVHLLESFALNFGVSSHRIAWPGDQPSTDLRASEMLLTMGARYSITW